jgi:L-lactate dehydrogenase (cytochrome)
MRGYMKNSRIDQCYNIEELHQLARRRLPSPFYYYLEGGSDDEYSKKNNIEAFDRYELIPRCLNDVSNVDTSTTALGINIELPVIIAPTGFSRMFHYQGEEAVARAAAKAGTIYSLSSAGSSTIENIASTTSGPKMFQLYMLNDREKSLGLINRARDAGYDTMCVAADLPILGNREDLLRVGLPPATKLTFSSLLSIVAHPKWFIRYIMDPPNPMANFFEGKIKHEDMGKFMPDSTFSWDDLGEIKKRWQGKFAVKGLMSVADAKMAVDAGADYIILSNHGGRQLDGVPSTIDMIAEFVDAVGDRAEIIVDSGFRRGTHILKALALGASACMIGRPYLYGLAAGGEAGVDRVLQMFREEIERGMMLLGINKLSQLDRSFIRIRE